MAFAPTAIGGAAAVRFGIKRNHDWVWLPSLATAATTMIPTKAEIDAGTLLTCAVESMSGFSVSDTYAEASDLCSDVNGKVWDGSSVDDSSIVFYMASDENDALDFFASGDDGYIVHAPYGLSGGKPAWVWAVTVGTVFPGTGTSGFSLAPVAFAPRAVKKVTLPADT